MTEPQPITVDTSQQKKQICEKSKKNTFKAKKAKKANKTNTQIIQPGGRAKSNRWQKCVDVSDGDVIVDIVDFKEPLNETVTRQVLPTSESWANRLYTISREEESQIW